MQIYGPYRVSTSALSGNNASSRPSQAAATPPTRGTAAPTDQLDLSSSHRLQSTAASTGPESVGGDIRIDRVADLRRQIADGSYETPEKLDAALDRILDSFA